MDIETFVIGLQIGLPQYPVGLEGDSVIIRTADGLSGVKIGVSQETLSRLDEPAIESCVRVVGRAFRKHEEALCH